MNLFLTSAGFDNKKIRQKVVNLLNFNIQNQKVLFIPTAAICEGGKAMLPFCRQEILDAGVLEKNITEREIKDLKQGKDLSDYRMIYVAGGDTQHLVNEMQKYNFKEILDDYLKTGGIYLGVSAGSIALTNTFDGCLNYINCKLDVHMEKGDHPGKIDKREYSEINLTDNQAIIIQDDKAEIFE